MLLAILSKSPSRNHDVDDDNDEDDDVVGAVAL